MALSRTMSRNWASRWPCHNRPSSSTTVPKSAYRTSSYCLRPSRSVRCWRVPSGNRWALDHPQIANFEHGMCAGRHVHQELRELPTTAQLLALSGAVGNALRRRDPGGAGPSDGGDALVERAALLEQIEHGVLHPGLRRNPGGMPATLGVQAPMYPHSGTGSHVLGRRHDHLDDRPAHPRNPGARRQRHGLRLPAAPRRAALPRPAPACLAVSGRRRTLRDVAAASVEREGGR